MSDKDKKRLSYIRKCYDSINSAELFFKHGNPNNFNEWKHDKEFLTVFSNLDYTFPSEEPKAIDIGCSSGKYLIPLINKEIDAVGLDITRIPLIYASKKISDADFVQASAANLPFKEETFDLVLCIEVLHQLSDGVLKKVLEQVNYVTKKGGYFVFDLKNKSNPILNLAYRKNDSIEFTLKARSLKEMATLLEKNGFKIVKEKGIFFPIASFAPFVSVFARKEE